MASSTTWIWGRDSAKTKTPPQHRSGDIPSNTNDGGAAPSSSIMNEIRIPKPGELQEGF